MYRRVDDGVALPVVKEVIFNAAVWFKLNVFVVHSILGIADGFEVLYGFVIYFGCMGKWYVLK